jgi:putative tricarboxylic transport membrane protein
MRPSASCHATRRSSAPPGRSRAWRVRRTAAILLSAFQNYGLQPGPQLFQTSSALVWTLIASLYIGNVMLLVLNLPLVGLWVKLLKIPKAQLYAGILIFATVGVYAMRQSPLDLVFMYVVGLLGVVMRRYDFPTAPVIVGLILGPLAEAQFRNAVSMGEGSFAVFVQRPMSLTLVVVALAVLLLPRLMRLLRRG